MASLLSPHRRSFRQLCCLMALITSLSPSAVVWAQQPVAPLRPFFPPGSVSHPADLSTVLPGSCVVILAKPRQLLTAECMQLLPIEVLSAASMKETGLDPVDVEQLVISMMPPVMGPPNFSISAKFTAPIQLKESQKLTGHTVPGELNGKAYLKSQHPVMPSIYQPDAKSLLLAPDAILHQLLRGDNPGETKSIFSAHLKEMSGDDLAVLVDLQPLQPFIQMGLAQAEIPPEVQPFLQAPGLIRLVKLRLNFSGKGPCELLVQANNAADADKLAGLVDQAIEMWRDLAKKKAETLLANEDPVQQAMGRYQIRMLKVIETQFRPTREGDSLVLFREEAGQGNSQLTSIAVIGVLVGLLLPAVQAAREAARRNQSMNNLKDMMLAMHNYHDAHRTFPAHASYDENGKPLLSWRVHILPYLEQQVLYEQFHLDEPWDSKHNRKLIPLMPAVYLDPSSGLSPEEGKTSYLGSAGKEAFFNGTKQSVRIAQIADGTSNTIAVLQVDDKHAAVWTKPVDWKVDAKRPLNGLGGLHPGIFLAALCDGSVQSIDNRIDPEVLKLLLTIADGEVIDAF